MASNPKTKLNTKLIAGLIIIIVAVSLGAVAIQYMFSQPSGELADMTLTLIGADEQQKTLTKQDILALEAYSGKGGIRSHGNQISGVGTYTGVPLTTLIDLVGGITSSQTVTARAEDNYTITYSYSQVVNGEDITTFDSTTGSETSVAQPLKLVLTYYRDGTALPSSEGPLRMGVLGEEGFVTQGNMWAKWVIELKVNPSSNPEPTTSPSKTPAPTATNPPSASPTAAPTATPTPTPSPSISNVQLTVVGTSGTQTVLTSTDLLGLTAYSADGGIKSGSGLSNYGTYMGVPILTICDLVGGVASGNTVRFTASDGYTSTYTYRQLNGQDIPTYNAAETAVTPTQPLTVIVAYYYNGAALPNDPGPLRVIAVGPDGYYMQGNLSPKMVVKIEILS